MPAASYGLLPILKKGPFFAIGEGSRMFVTCFLHSSAQMCLYQTPGRRPPPITGRFVNTVTRGWVEPLTSAPRSDFMAQSLFLSIDVCPGLGISPLQTSIWLSFSQADLGPRSAQECFFRGFEKFETFFSKICAHSERYRNTLAGIFEILTCDVSIVTGIRRSKISQRKNENLKDPSTAWQELIEHACKQNNQDLS